MGIVGIITLKLPFCKIGFKINDIEDRDCTNVAKPTLPFSGELSASIVWQECSDGDIITETSVVREKTLTVQTVAENDGNAVVALHQGTDCTGEIL